jgi:hypothetical protein
VLEQPVWADPKDPKYENCIISKINFYLNFNLTHVGLSPVGMLLMAK